MQSRMARLATETCESSLCTSGSSLGRWLACSRSSTGGPARLVLERVELEPVPAVVELEVEGGGGIVADRDVTSGGSADENVLH